MVRWDVLCSAEQFPFEIRIEKLHIFLLPHLLPKMEAHFSIYEFLIYVLYYVGHIFFAPCEKHDLVELPQAQW